MSLPHAHANRSKQSERGFHSNKCVSDAQIQQSVTSLTFCARSCSKVLPSSDSFICPVILWCGAAQKDHTHSSVLAQRAGGGGAGAAAASIQLVLTRINQNKKTNKKKPLRKFRKYLNINNCCGISSHAFL